MAENKENLEEIIDHDQLMADGKEALEDRKFEKAWTSFLKVFDDKKASKKYRGEAGNLLCKVMKEIPLENELLDKLITTDTDLKKKSRIKVVTNDYARIFLGRKYLRKAADDFEHLASLKEYTAYCFGHGPERSFAYQYEDKDALVGLQWINKLMLVDDDEAQALGHAMKCKYHIVQYTKHKNPQDRVDFCDNAVKAYDLVGETNGYVTYYYAFVCADPSLKAYEEGKYHDPKRGYEMFVKTIELSDDPIVVADCKKRKQWFEDKFADIIK